MKTIADPFYTKQIIEWRICETLKYQHWELEKFTKDEVIYLYTLASEMEKKFAEDIKNKK